MRFRLKVVLDHTNQEQGLEKIEESEKRLKELAKKSGMPMTGKECEKRKAEREKARAAK